MASFIKLGKLLFRMYDKVINLLREATKHHNIKLTDRGNSAIFIALYIAKKLNPKPYILIPDQGGWVSFRTYPKLLNMEIKEIKTNRGVIDIADLDQHAKTGSALIVTSFAGYFAEQPLESISKVCKKYGCLLIEDVSGALGDGILCNGLISDMIVCSFGKWKPINLDYGGFISVSNKQFFEIAREPISLVKVYSGVYEKLLPYLEKNRLPGMLSLAAKVKKKLGSTEIFHPDKRGINVVTAYEDKVIKFCEKNKYPYILCPTYIRVNEKAISIELKRLQ